jgi:hypothetical protein
MVAHNRGNGMTTNMHHYKMSQKEIGRHTCIGCGVNVIRAGDYCMMRSEIWDGKLNLKPTDNMCIACIESRLGRNVQILDFSSFPSIEGFDLSEVLKHRLGYYRHLEERKRKKARQRAKRRLALKRAA